MKTILEYLINNHVKQSDNDSFAIGDILYYDAGYNMTLPHFLRIVEINKTGKSCKVEELKNKVVDGSMMCGKVMPDMNKEAKNLDKQFRIKYSTYYKGEPYITIDKHDAYKWNGQSMVIDMMD